MSDCIDPKSAIAKPVSAASTVFGAAMAADRTDIRVFISSTNCWVAQGTSPAPVASSAAPGTGSVYVPANVPFLVFGDVGADIAVIQDQAGGKATLCRLKRP